MAFPYCVCNNTVGVTPYSLSDSARRTTVRRNGRTNNLYEFEVRVNTPVDPRSKCANTDLFKAEFWSSLKCQRAVLKARVNGNEVSPIFDAKNGVWRVTNLNMNVVSARSATIALELDSAGPCPTLDQLCNRFGGRCVYAMFDTSKACCPTYYNLYSVPRTSSG